MDSRVIKFPRCVQTAHARASTLQVVKKASGCFSLVVQHVDVADDSDMSRLLAVLAQQQGIAKVTFRHMTFPGMQAQMMLAFMSRRASFEVKFEVCCFMHFRHCDMAPLHPCTSVELDRCKILPRECDDFISSVLASGGRFIATRVVRCLGNVYLISGRSA